MASSVRIIINIQQHQGHHQHLQDRLNLVITNHAVGIRRLHSFTILITNHAVGIRRLHSFKVLIRTHAVGIRKLHSFRVIITNHAITFPSVNNALSPRSEESRNQPLAATRSDRATRDARPSDLVSATALPPRSCSRVESTADIETR